jgi:hypothetical protein
VTRRHGRAHIASGIAVAVVTLVVGAGWGATDAAAQASGSWDANVAKVSSSGVTVTVSYTSDRPGVRITDATLHYVKGPAGCTLPDDSSATTPVESPSPTTTEPPTTTAPASQTVSQEFTFDDAAPTCNGMFTVQIQAQGTAVPPESDPMQRPMAVAVPAPKVRDLSAVGNPDRTVRISWVPGLHTPPGTRYEVSRVDVATGESTPLAESSTSPTVDTVPDSGGTFAYSVASVRPDENGDYTVRNAVRSSPPVTFESVVETTTPTAPPGTTGTPSGGGGRGPVRNAPPATPPPADFEGDGGAAGPAVFDATEPGEADAVLPESARGVQRYDSPPGAGILEPVAIALCLAVWAAIVFSITRMARRAEDALAVVAIEHDV